MLRQKVYSDILPHFWVAANLNWLLRTYVRGKDRLGLHRQPLPLRPVGLGHRSRRGIVLVHQ
jgi:hypothetical protein